MEAALRIGSEIRVVLTARDSILLRDHGADRQGCRELENSAKQDGTVQQVRNRREFVLNL